MTSEGRAGVGEGSTGRRGGAEALRSTALVATGGFGHCAGARQDGRSGHPWATPRPAGGSVAQGQRGGGPRGAPAGPEARHLRSRVALSSELDGGRPTERGRAWRHPGWEGGETSAPFTPTPRTRRHARQAASGPGNPPGPRAQPGGCWPWWVAVFGGVAASAGRSPVAGRAARVQRAPRGRCGRLA